MIFTHHQISLGRSNQGKCSVRGMWHAWEVREKCTRFSWESLKERDHSENRAVDRRMGLECISRRLAGGRGVKWIYLPQDRDCGGLL
jgi:hypothetical protein